tara:strand:+ start:1853 stop:2515 length:663 start_codon:yes stop_codon:yes gene_type:complete
MANQTIQSFGLFSGSGGGGGGAGTVTSVTAGTGLTASPNPITASGTISLASVNGLVTSFVSTGGTSASVISTGPVPMYTPATYPPTNFTLTQNGRATIATQDAGAGGSQIGRIGAGGLGMFDEISLSGEIFTTCNSGILILSPSSNGIFAGKLSVGNPNFVCNGTTQTSSVDLTTFRVGDLNVAPSTATTDYLQVVYASSATSGNIGYNNLTMTITQFSA